VALIEKGRLGGTCVNVGCVPKKVMWNAAGLAENLKLAPDYGFDLTRDAFSWARLKARRDAFVQRLNDIYRRNLQTAKVTEIAHAACFLEPHVIEAGGRRLTAPHVLIATGSHPSVPDIAGAELGITSDDFFALQNQPSRAFIAGSGYVAVELAGVLQALGTKVTLLCRHEHPLRHFDELLGSVLRQEMQKAGMRIETHAEVLRVEQSPNHEKIVTLSNGKRLEGFDLVLWAIGRAPVIVGLGLERTGIELAGARIAVDEYQNTSVAGHYAVGDVTGNAPLTPVAIAAGRRLADRLFDGQTTSKVDYHDIASVVFSHPPIGTVGLSEQAAAIRFGADSVEVYESRYTNMFYALGETRHPSFVKVVVRLPEETIVGIHVIGLGADELIQGFAVAMKLGATKADFDRTLAIHPTAAEEVVTVSSRRLAKSGLTPES
jgi:glutathione reductase (NADPH)